jgi:hypothetical protein
MDNQRDSMYQWNFQCLQGVTEFECDILKEIHQIFLEGFGLPAGWSFDGIKNRLQKSTLLGLLSDGRKIVGYSIFSVPNIPLQGKYLLWEDSICLRKQIQGKNLSVEAIKGAMNSFPNKQFGWVGGRTQNPIILKRYAKFGKLFPFDATYSDGEGKILMEYLLHNVAEVKEVKQIDLCTGICRNFYSEGRLGDYSIAIEKIEQFEKQLRNWNFNRHRGDCIIVVSQLAAKHG